MEPLFKYPRTPHLAGSGLQQGDDRVEVVPLASLRGQFLVIEEKMDGANCGIRFDRYGALALQSRGHVLRGGPRERQFDVFKSWAQRYTAELWAALGSRYVLYGEWCAAKHSIFYTDLPHWFLEFDILDTATSEFLSTARRRELLSACPFVASVRVITQGAALALSTLPSLVGKSPFIADDQREQLVAAAVAAGLDAEQVVRETDTTGLMEGLYIKVEDADRVLARYKYVRPAFLQTLLDSGSHWM